MKNKTALATMLLLLVTFVLVLGTSNVFAQGPSNTSPGSAVYLDNQTHFVPPNTTLWYKFDYSAEQLPVEITLFSGVPQQMQFNVYTPDQIGTDFSVGNPIGRGLPPSGSDNMLWRSVFPGAGTFYVELINPTAMARTYLLSITGGGYRPRVQPPAPTSVPIRIAPPPPPPPSPTINLMQVVMIPAIATLRAQSGTSAAVTTTAPVTTTITVIEPSAPTVSPTPQTIVIVVVPATPVPAPTMPIVPTATLQPAPPPVVNDYFTSAFYVVNGRTYTIPGNSERWFAFDYAGDRSKIEIRIPGGNEKKLQFRLFTMDQVLRYTVDGTPIGIGTAPIVSCDTGRCVSNDLVWAGDFTMNGTYFIQVTNFDPTSKNYELTVTGGGVVLGK